MGILILQQLRYNWGYFTVNGGTYTTTTEVQLGGTLPLTEVLILHQLRYN